MGLRYAKVAREEARGARRDRAAASWPRSRSKQGDVQFFVDDGDAFSWPGGADPEGRGRGRAPAAARRPRRLASSGPASRCRRPARSTTTRAASAGTSSPTSTTARASRCPAAPCARASAATWRSRVFEALRGARSRSGRSRESAAARRRCGQRDFHGVDRCSARV